MFLSLWHVFLEAWHLGEGRTRAERHRARMVAQRAVAIQGF